MAKKSSAAFSGLTIFAMILLLPIALIVGIVQGFKNFGMKP